VKGKLILIGVPIGNILDISSRAIEFFSSCDAILCEDTRETEYVLNQININKPLLAYGGGRQEKNKQKAIDMMQKGSAIGFVCDRGMPGISDPGACLVEEVRKLGIEIICAPGVSSVTTAFAMSGYSGGFIFHGFLPRKEIEILTIISKLAPLDYNLIFFESRFRLKKTLEIFEKVLNEREIVLAKDLTKTTEKILKGPIFKLINEKFLGEYVIIIKRP